MRLLLYYAPNACSLVPYVTLTEAGAPFEIRPLNFRKSQHMTAEYLQINPKHKVPTLVIDGSPRSSYSRITGSWMTSLAIANGSSTISPLSMRTSFGAFGEALSSTSIFPNSRTAWPTSSA